MDQFDAAPPATPVPPGGWDAEERRLELQRDRARARAAALRWIVIGVLVLLGLLAWMFRWEITPLAASGDRPPAAFALDRLTGQIHYLQQDSRLPVEDLK